MYIFRIFIQFLYKYTFFKALSPALKALGKFKRFSAFSPYSIPLYNNVEKFKTKEERYE